MSNVLYLGHVSIEASSSFAGGSTRAALAGSMNEEASSRCELR
jgi:hypothetical protein